jgi:hypothetical protein
MVLQFGYRAGDLPALLRELAAGIESLGDDAEVLDLTVRPDGPRGDVYFVRR